MDIAQVSIFQATACRIWRTAHRLSWNRLFLWALLVSGAALRLSLITEQRFHGDEAIYGYWAQLVASGQDPLLLSVPLDKPPLFIYLLAGIFKLFGPTEIAARLISEIASLSAVVLTYKLGQRLYSQPEALLAAAVMALSPFNILFAATTFTDPLMVALVLAAMNLATVGHWGWAGVATGLAVATKQQGVLFAPLVVAAGWIAAWATGRTSTPSASAEPLCRGLTVKALSNDSASQDSRPSIDSACSTRNRVLNIAQIGLGFLAVTQLLIGWDALRWRVRASFWEQSAVSHGPVHLVNWWELGGRLADWSKLLNYVLGSPVMNAALLLGIPLLLWRNLWAMKVSSDRTRRIDWLLAGFGAFFFLVHWLFSFSVWDRYLLGLVPLTSLLLARVMWQGLTWAGLSRLCPTGLLIVLLLAMPAAGAVQGKVPIGGDQRTYLGLEEVVAFFRQEVPPNSVVWHHYLGWHYFHYLFGAPLDLRWYAAPETLATLASQARDVPNYVTFPAWEKESEVETQAALEAIGLGLMPERHVQREDGSPAFTVYRIITADRQPGVTWMSENR